MVHVSELSTDQRRLLAYLDAGAGSRGHVGLIGDNEITRLDHMIVDALEDMGLIEVVTEPSGEDAYTPWYRLTDAGHAIAAYLRHPGRHNP